MSGPVVCLHQGQGLGCSRQSRLCPRETRPRGCEDTSSLGVGGLALQTQYLGQLPRAEAGGAHSFLLATGHLRATCLLLHITSWPQQGLGAEPAPDPRLRDSLHCGDAGPVSVPGVGVAVAAPPLWAAESLQWRCYQLAGMVPAAVTGAGE